MYKICCANWRFYNIRASCVSPGDTRIREIRWAAGEIKFTYVLC